MTSPLPARRWITKTYGDISNLKLENVSIPPPLADEVRISVHAIGLNFADVFATLGLYSAAGRPPFTPGFEVSGVIQSVGTCVSTYSPGDRVFALTRFGGFATALNVRASRTQRLPEDWSFEDGAAFTAQALTAWYALCVLGGLPTSKEAPCRFVTSEQRAVLIHSAAGGVGLRLVEMVLKIGGVPVCTVGNEEKVGFLQSKFGLEREKIIVRGVDDEKDGFYKTLMEGALAGVGGLDVVVDSVMGGYFQPGYKALNRGGRYVVMGTASIMPQGAVGGSLTALWNFVGVVLGFLKRPKMDLIALMDQNKSVAGFNVGRLFEENQLFELAFEEMGEMGLEKSTIGKRFGFEEAQEALRYFQSGKSIGKLVLTVEGEPSSRM